MSYADMYAFSMITVFTSEMPHYIIFGSFSLLCLGKWSARINLTAISHILTSRRVYHVTSSHTAAAVLSVYYMLLAAVILSSSSTSSASFLLPYLKWHLSPCAFTRLLLSQWSVSTYVFCAPLGRDFIHFPQNFVQPGFIWGATAE